MAFQEHLLSEMAHVSYSIVTILLKILLMNHLIACGWFGIGSLSYDDHWVKNFEFENASVTYQYSSSLHWSLAQLGFGSMEVEPVNTIERVFAIVVLFCAVVVVSFLLGTVCNLMDHLQDMRSEQNQQFWLIKRYCMEHKVPAGLSRRIQRFVEHVEELRKVSLDHLDVPAFKLLSEPLFAELLTTVNAPYLSTHPFFKKLVPAQFGGRAVRQKTQIHTTIAHKLCNEALRTFSLAGLDVLFCQGDAAEHTYYVHRGRVKYMQQTRQGTVGPKVWVSEAALWTKWTHVGEMMASTDCQVVAVVAAVFCEIMALHPDTFTYAKEYGSGFLETMNARPLADQTDMEQHKEGGVLVCGERAPVAAAPSASTGVATPLPPVSPRFFNL